MTPDRHHPAAPTHSSPEATDAADATLRAALQALPMADAASVDALSARVMAQWQQRRGHTGAAVHQGGQTLAARLWQRRLWVGSASLVAVAAVATAVLVTRPDPSIEELMQPDVLSQMAIGEM